MIVLSTIPEPVVTIALRMAKSVPRDRTRQQHWECVYYNFCDFFSSWEDFVAKATAFKGSGDRW